MAALDRHWVLSLSGVGALTTRMGRLRVAARRDPLLRNSLFIMATTVANSLLGFGYWVVAARLYPVSSVGLAAAFISAFSVAGTLANPAIHSGLVQVLPRTESGRPWSVLVNGGLVVGTVSSVVVGAVVGIVLSALSGQFAIVTHSPIEFLGFILGVVGAVTAIIVDQIFIGERAAQWMLVRNVGFGAAKIPLLLVGLLGSRSSSGIWTTWVAVALASVGLAVAVGFPALRRGYSAVVAGARQRLVAMASDLAGHHLTNLGALLPMYILPVEVVTRVSTRANAYYYVTWMLCSVFFMVSPAVSSALFAEGSHDPGSIRASARRSLAITGALLALPMAAYLVLGRFLLGIYGPAYARNGTALMVVLVASAVPDAVTNLYVSVLRVERRLLHSSALNVAMATTTIVGAWFLLPGLGVVGAGVAWLAAQSLGTVWTIVSVSVLHRASLDTRSELVVTLPSCPIPEPATAVADTAVPDTAVPARV